MTKRRTFLLTQVGKRLMWPNCPTDITVAFLFVLDQRFKSHGTLNKGLFFAFKIWTKNDPSKPKVSQDRNLDSCGRIHHQKTPGSSTVLSIFIELLYFQLHRADKKQQSRMAHLNKQTGYCNFWMVAKVHTLDVKDNFQPPDSKQRKKDLRRVHTEHITRRNMPLTWPFEKQKNIFFSQ